MKVLVVGAGIIAAEYCKAIIKSGHEPVVVTRGSAKASELRTSFPGITIVEGGIKAYLKDNEALDTAIVAAPIDYLVDITTLLLNKGSKKLLVEKPLSYRVKEVKLLAVLAKEKSASVHIAYNRRSYSSVIQAREMIIEDGGATSLFFDFTEAIFRVNPQLYSQQTLEHWGLANSTHVIDTAFYLAGKPVKQGCNVTGNAISWHPSGSIFSGHGTTENGGLFAYHANWGAPGRWKVEVQTSQRKILLAPMEELAVQKAGSFAIEKVPAATTDDTDCKPGFLKQVKRLLQNDTSELCSLQEYHDLLPVYQQILSYK
jgi:predicted dehydrogenase